MILCDQVSSNQILSIRPRPWPQPRPHPPTATIAATIATIATTTATTTATTNSRPRSQPQHGYNHSHKHGHSHNYGHSHNRSHSQSHNSNHNHNYSYGHACLNPGANGCLGTLFLLEDDAVIATLLPGVSKRCTVRRELKFATPPVSACMYRRNSFWRTLSRNGRRGRDAPKTAR